jgi:hypothetical protein
MRYLRVGASVLVMLLVVCFSHPAHASGCWDINYLSDVNCTGPNGCTGSYPLEYCTFGCVSGTCEDRGGSGLCCGRLYYTPVIYPDGGRCDPGGGCGTGRAHASRPTATSSPHAQQLLQGRSPGVIKVSDNFGYREPTFAYVYDRCRHEYAVLVEEKGAFVAGGN